MNNCFLCGNQITSSNDSNEHIIPNAIGGRRTIKGFICNPCNNKTGKDWDVKLTNQLNPLNLLLVIRRDRGEVRPQAFKTISGKEYYLRANGSMIPFKPTFNKTPMDKGYNFSFVARDEREAQQFLKSIKRDFPNFDIDSYLGNMKVEEVYITDDPLHMELRFGGLNEGRSLIKSLLAFCFSRGIAPSMCNTALSFLREEGEACFGWYYQEDDIIIKRNFTKPMHCLAIQGNPSEGTLLGYLEFFGVLRIVACLSNEYKGDAFKSSYCLAPEDWEESEFDFEINVSIKELNDVYSYRKCDASIQRASMVEFLNYTQVKGEDRERNRVTESFSNELISKLSQLENEFTRQEFSQIYNEVLSNSQLLPYILSRIKKGGC
ncbi:MULTISPECIES: HNH endonuclease [unclassified Pantoea]|uniref:HNH endonuclease n=1 Tax=unclassified Pantoea TaxID=2630326 RepID=UPI001CD77874|nr:MULTISPECIES: HNH endonuclease [unclassified Pantoea]MCA1176166.1 HNH endonuclease [Pantoea sp. alder69]MCA1249137.1 HNH endonuclease [Pantoea sp. alder70]MCA1264788.1 HNH endonuclease [Pantoea sp. alder81]